MLLRSSKLRSALSLPIFSSYYKKHMLGFDRWNFNVINTMDNKNNTKFRFNELKFQRSASQSSRNVLKGQILIDSAIPWSRSGPRKCVPNSNYETHEVFVVISLRGFLFLPTLECWHLCKMIHLPLGSGIL